MRISNQTNYLMTSGMTKIPPGKTFNTAEPILSLNNMFIYSEGKEHPGFCFTWENPEHLIVQESNHPDVQPLETKTRNIQFDKIRHIKNLTNYVITTQGDVILPQTETDVDNYGEFMPFIEAHFWSSPDGTIAQAGPL